MPLGSQVKKYLFTNITNIMKRRKYYALKIKFVWTSIMTLNTQQEAMTFIFIHTVHSFKVHSYCLSRQSQYAFKNRQKGRPTTTNLKKIVE